MRPWSGAEKWAARNALLKFAMVADMSFVDRWLPQVRLGARRQMRELETDDIVALVHAEGFIFLRRSEILEKVTDPAVHVLLETAAPPDHLHVLGADGASNTFQTITLEPRLSS